MCHLLFPWYAMERQISISGVAEKVSAQESDDYFATRPWGSQIGAWASASIISRCIIVEAN